MTQRSSVFYALDRRSFYISLFIFILAIALCVYVHKSARDTWKYIKVIRIVTIILTVVVGLRFVYMGLIFLVPGEKDAYDEALFEELKHMNKDISLLGQGKLDPNSDYKPMHPELYSKKGLDGPAKSGEV